MKPGFMGTHLWSPHCEAVLPVYGFVCYTEYKYRSVYLLYVSSLITIRFVQSQYKNRENNSSCSREWPQKENNKRKWI